MTISVKLLLIALIWLVAGRLLMWTLGAALAPSGGLDSIAAALVYVLFWRLLVWGPPIVLALIGLFSWIWKAHRGALVYIILGVVLLIAAVTVYQKVLRKYLLTPKRCAAKIESYASWAEEERKGNALWGLTEWTEQDYICEYVKEEVANATLGRLLDVRQDADDKLRAKYLEASMERAVKDIPHVTGWENVQDILRILTPRSDDDRFYLEDADYVAISAHYGRPLSRDHWNDRYTGRNSSADGFLSEYPMMMIFYDDGTMDIAPYAPYRFD